MSRPASDATDPDAPLLGRAALERLADAALELREAAGVEVLVQHERGGLTRFANSQIHQNVWTDDVEVGVRVVTADGRQGVASAHTDDPAVVAATAADALRLAEVSPVDPDFPGLAPTAEAATVLVDEPTLAASPGDRAADVRAVLAEVPDTLEAAGAYQTRASELGVFTTTGQRAYAPLSSAQLTLVVIGPSSSGYAEAGGRARSEVDPAGSARRAVGKAKAGVDPVGLDAGDYKVVLEPAATGTLVQFLSYLAFGGKAYLEGRSVASQRLGEQVADRRITIVDDALSPATLGFPFDFEGTPKRRVDLIRDGVLAGVVHDRRTARKAGAVSTGHGLPAPNPHGPFAVNPLLMPGDGGGVDDLVAGTERGLLVTRFHYANVVHPLRTAITGMTRDGTFLIEDGRLTRGVRNLRFTQSILGALEHVDAVGTDTGYATELFFGGSRWPALALPRFAFTGTTTFG